MNRKPGFIPIVIAIVVAAVLVGGVTYGTTNSKRNKVIKDQELKIEELTQDLEDLKTQLSSEELSTPSVPSVPSTPSSPSKPSTPSAKPAIPATPAAPATPTQPANMKTWSGKLVTNENVKTDKYIPLSFQYPAEFNYSTSGNTPSNPGMSYMTVYDKEYKNTISISLMGEGSASLTKEKVKNIYDQFYGKDVNAGLYTSLSVNDIKMTTIGGKPAGQFKDGKPDGNGQPTTNVTLIQHENGLLKVEATLSVESAYQQILSSMKF